MGSLSYDDIAYAMECTRVVHEPDRRIDTFGTTNFEYCLITELLDEVNKVRVREGRVEAGRPRIFRPGDGELEFEGFGEHAETFRNWLREVAGDLTFLRYGFKFATRDIETSLVHEPAEMVAEKAVDEIVARGNPSKAVIVGLDDTWEISLLRFTGEMVERSGQINVFDFKRRGLL